MPGEGRSCANQLPLPPAEGVLPMQALGQPMARVSLWIVLFACFPTVPLLTGSAFAAEVVVFDPLNADNGRWTLDEWTQIRDDGLHLTRSKMVWAYDVTDGCIELHTEHVSGPLEQGYGLCSRAGPPVRRPPRPRRRPLL